MMLNGKTAYLSGPVSGVPRGECEAAFAAADRACLECGAWSVWNPVKEVPEDSAHDQAMLACLRGLLGTWNSKDVVVQLPGWEESEGCMVEAEVARACGIAVVPLEEVRP